VASWVIVFVPVPVPVPVLVPEDDVPVPVPVAEEDEENKVTSNMKIKVKASTMPASNSNFVRVSIVEKKIVPQTRFDRTKHPTKKKSFFEKNPRRNDSSWHFFSSLPLRPTPKKKKLKTANWLSQQKI